MGIGREYSEKMPSRSFICFPMAELFTFAHQMLYSTSYLTFTL